MKVETICAVALVAIGIVACASPPDPAVKPALIPNPHFASPRGEYGYSRDNPIMVGSLGGPNRVANEHIYLRRLRTLDGRAPRFERSGGGCCPFPTPNSSFADKGLLDTYAVFADPLEEPLVLYLNMYDPGEVRAPDGLRLASADEAAIRHFAWAALKVHPARPTDEITPEDARLREAAGQGYYIATYDKRGRILSLEKRLHGETFLLYTYAYPDGEAVRTDIPWPPPE